MSETGSETRSGIGARLRAGRERMGLTQLQAAEKLHVDAKVIESLEAERFDALGAAVFVRGHLRHFAELVGEQPAQLVEIYAASTQPAAPDLTRLPKAAPATHPSRLAVPALLVLIAFVLIGVVWWILQSVGGAGGAGSATAAREVSVEPVTEPPPPVAESVSPQPPAAATPTATAAAPASATASASATSGTAEATPAAAPVRGKPVEVTLHFAADSWVEIYDANGERLFYDIGSADSQRTISGTPPLRVTFGNAPGVTLDVNGKAATVPANVVRDDTAHFVINRSGRIVRARPRPEGN